MTLLNKTNFKIPLAWLQLSHQPLRLLIALAGIGFADILMFMQLGFREALFDSISLIPQKLTADLVILHSNSDSFYSGQTFPRQLLYQTLSLNSVKSAAPLFIASGQWKNPKAKTNRSLAVFGINPVHPVLDFDGLNENLNTIKLSNVVLFDTGSRPEFGTEGIVSSFREGKPITTELNGKQVRIGGLFTFGASFASDGNVIVSDTTFLNLFPQQNKTEIYVGVIQLEPNSDIEAVRQQLQSKLPETVKVMTHEGLVEFEKHYWRTATPIGFIFTVGTLIGFMVGVVIVYQILSNDIANHLPEYATLKAIGYSQGYLLGIIFRSALILAVLGYIPGITISIGLYSLTEGATKLPIAMNLVRALTVLILTLLMCACSAALTVRRLKQADPADIF